MKKLKWVISLGVVILLGGGFLVKKSLTKKEEFSQLNATVTDFAMKVKASGTVTPKNKVVVPSPINGRIDQVLVEEGAKVTKGQVLAIVSSADRVALMDSINSDVTAEEKARIEAMYKPITVLSPASGTIVKRAIDKGQSVSPESLMFEVSDVLIVLSKVDEADIAKVQTGLVVEVVVDAYPGQTFQGVVERIGQQSIVTNNVTTYEVFIKLDDKLPPSIKSGMSASVSYVIAQKKAVLAIPAWMSEGRRNTNMELFVSDSAGRPVKKSIELGDSNGEVVEVVSGLSQQDVILFKPMSYESDEKGTPFSITGSKKK